MLIFWNHIKRSNWLISGLISFLRGASQGTVNKKMRTIKDIIHHIRGLWCDDVYMYLFVGGFKKTGYFLELLLILFENISKTTFWNHLGNMLWILLPTFCYPICHLHLFLSVSLMYLRQIRIQIWWWNWNWLIIDDFYQNTSILMNLRWHFVW